MVGIQLRILAKERLPRDLRLMKNRYKIHSFSSTSSNTSSASYTPSTYISFTSFQVQMVVTAANTGGCWGGVRGPIPASPPPTPPSPPTHMSPTHLQSNTPLFPLFQVRDYHQQSTRLPAPLPRLSSTCWCSSSRWLGFPSRPYQAYTTVQPNVKPIPSLVLLSINKT
jgi:hypothetical protein